MHLNGRDWACTGHLELALLGEGPLLENVQDEGSAVADARLLRASPRKVPELAGAQLAIKDDCVCPSADHSLQQLVHFAWPKVCLSIWVYVLRETPNHLNDRH